MRVDPEYLKHLLNAFQDAEEPSIDIEGLQQAGIDYSESRFEFHLLQLRDEGFVADFGDGTLGIQHDALGNTSWSVVRLRLTSSGQKFADALDNQNVMAAIKKNYVGTAIGTMAKSRQAC